MLELVNTSNYQSDVEIIHDNPDCLEILLNRHQLHGIEMMFNGEWNQQVHKKEWIHGVHLSYWPCWLEFWQGDEQKLWQEFGSKEKVAAYYGGLTRQEWLNGYRKDIATARQAEAKYIVFHVSHARPSELFHCNFSSSSRDVIEASIDVINELTREIPDHITLLFENLWWPGLTLRDQSLTRRLLENVNHPNVGIMLDTGHLMNTNPSLLTEKEGIDYIMKTLVELGSCAKYIKGIHLHRSLSGQYIKRTKKNSPQGPYSGMDIMNHVMKIDEHLPFCIPDVRRIIDFIQPDYLVHEFFYDSMNDWAHKITQQQQALYGTSAKTN